MSLQELFQLLNYIEVCVMAEKLYFDGTLPSHELEHIHHKSKWLQEFSKNKILPITAENAGILIGYCKSAAEQSSELIQAINIKDILTNGMDRPVKQFQGFRDAILKAYPSEKAKQETSVQIADDILAGKETFNGGKCLIGILTAELPDANLLEIVVEKFDSCTSEEEQAFLVGALINRFRINYVNKISSQDEYEAAYLIDPAIEAIQSQQITLLWRYILKKMERKNLTASFLTAVF
jgi:hypothetical protein